MTKRVSLALTDILDFGGRVSIFQTSDTGGDARATFWDSLFKHEDGRKIVELGNTQIDVKKFIDFFRISATQLKQAFAEEGNSIH